MKTRWYLHVIVLTELANSPGHGLLSQIPAPFLLIMQTQQLPLLFYKAINSHGWNWWCFLIDNRIPVTTLCPNIFNHRMHRAHLWTVSWRWSQAKQSHLHETYHLPLHILYLNNSKSKTSQVHSSLATLWAHFTKLLFLSVWHFPCQYLEQNNPRAINIAFLGAPSLANIILVVGH
jgi:hypothetical protein